MKNIILLFGLVSGITCYAQPNTNTVLGLGTPTQDIGNYNIFIGCLTGPYPLENIDYNTIVGAAAFGEGVGSNNTAVGYYSLPDGEKCTAIGTESLHSNSAGQNVAVGYRAMYSNVDGERNVAVGSLSMYSNSGYDNTSNGHRSLYTNTTGSYNTAHGSMSLYLNVSGDMNTATGYAALRANTTGGNNTATGTYSLYANTTGTYNTATGRSALSGNSTGSYNTGNGYQSLNSNSSGSNNTASGSHSLYTNSIGKNNTAYGYRALYSNTVSFNTAIGGYSMQTNVNGQLNTAVGYYTLSDNTSGSRNSAEGYRALYSNTTGSYNTAQGAHALNYVSTGSFNSALGYDAGPTLTDLNNTTAIGYLAVPTASNQVRIGNTSVTSIGGEVGWTEFSDGRFKKDVKEDVSGLDFISQLRPVSYTVDQAQLNGFLNVHDSSSNQTQAKSLPVRKTGFIAQEVEALIRTAGFTFSGVDAPENENDPYGIRYAEFVVPLVKAVQELSESVKMQQQKIDEQQQQIQALLGSKSLKGFNESTTAALHQNSPNPFDAETEIRLTLPEDVGFATVMIYNLEGKQLKTLQVKERGDVRVKISANELSAGMYLYSLIADGKVVDTKRMVLTK